MGLFQRIFDSMSKGYKSATENASPSVSELHTMRQLIVNGSNNTSTLRSADEQVELRRDLSEVDSMIGRANKLMDRKTAQSFAG